MNIADDEMVRQSKTELQAALTEGGSSLRKYQKIVVGSDSICDLLRYELVTSLFGLLPGAAGMALRKMFYPGLLGKCGRGVVFGRNVTLRHPGKIFLGKNVILDDNCVLDAKGSANRGIFIGDNVIVGRNSVISCKDGDIFIGDNGNIAMNCFIQSARSVTIGDNVLFAAYCYVIGGGDHETDRTDIPIIAQGQIVKGIAIEDNCWIGAGVMVLDGVRIGRDSIIGTGAVVTRDIAEFSVAAGVPAAVRRDRRK